jgi:hypothetical protein
MTLTLVAAAWVFVRQRLAARSVAVLGGGVLLATALVPGCAQWEAAQYNLSKLKDDRVSDIESHLDRRAPVVASPFGVPSKPSDQ